MEFNVNEGLHEEKKNVNEGLHVSWHGLHIYYVQIK